MCCIFEKQKDQANKEGMQYGLKQGLGSVSTNAKQLMILVGCFCSIISYLKAQDNPRYSE